MTPGKVSLVVGTRGRSGELARFINSLSNQNVESLQLIVVDQSDSEGRAANAAAIAVAMPWLDVMHIHQDAVGLSRARNLGLQSATGDFVGFPDDDCWYRDGFLRDVVRWFESNPAYNIVSGVYGEPERVHPRFPTSARKLSPINVARCVSSVTLFFRDSVFASGLRFAEHIGAGTEIVCGEEIELLSRALLAGHRGWFQPSLVVHHAINRASTTGESVAKRATANAYVTWARATDPARRSTWLMVRILASTTIGLIRALFSASGRNEFRSKMRGYKLAMQNGHARSETR